MENYTSIDNFISNSFINSEGFLKPSRFKVDFTFPSEFSPFDGTQQNVLKLMLQNNIISASLPNFGVSDSAKPQFRTLFTSRIKDNITMTFYESADLKIKTYIWAWINAIVQNDNSNEKQNDWQREYYDNIIASVNVHTIKGDDNNSIFFDRFTEIYPITAGNITYDQTDENNFGKITVTFKYRYHYIKN